MCDETLCSHHFSIVLVENFKNRTSRSPKLSQSERGASNAKVVSSIFTGAITTAILFVFVFVKYTLGTHCSLVSNFGHFSLTGPYSSVGQSVVLITPRS